MASIAVFVVISFVTINASRAADPLAKEQVLRYALNASDASTFEPHRIGGGQDKLVAGLLFSGLLRYPPGNEINLEPDLATSWEASSDKKEWVFHLRKGVKFHPFPGYPSGYELTADDVVYSFKRAANPNYSAASADYKGMTFEPVDTYTFKVICENPISEILMLPRFANLRGGFIVCKKAMEEKGEDWAKTNPVGTGPFIFKSYEPRQKTVLIQNATYFRGAPLLNEVVIRYMPLVSSRELGLQSGELEMAEGQVDSKWVEKMNSLPGIKALTYGPSETSVLHINMAKAPFNDIRVRKALSYGISREQEAQLMGEMIAVPLYSPTLAPPATGAITKEEAMQAGVVYEDNVPMAKQLLAEAGYPNGFKTEVIISEMTGYKKTMIDLKEQLKRVGIELELNVVDHPSFHNLIRKDSSSLVLYHVWRANIDASLGNFFHSDSIVVTGKQADVNFSHMASIDDLIMKARDETDSAKQIALWKEAQIAILKEVAVVPLTRKKTVYAIKSYVDLGHKATWMWTTSNAQISEQTKILTH